MGTVTSFKRGLRKGKRKPPKKEVAGPYRSQSSVPEIRKKATKREHRKIPVAETPRPKKQPKAKRARRMEEKALKTLRDVKAPIAPQVEYQKSKYRGRAPSSELKRLYPRAYKKAEKAFEAYHDEREGLKEDPLAELVISTAATAGLGAAAKGAAALTKSALAARAGSEIASTGVTAASKAAETGVKGVAARTASKAGKAVKARATSKAQRVRTAPKRMVKRAKETPKRIKSAPKRAKRAAATKEGRRRAARRARRTAVRHPIKTGVPSAAALPPGVIPADIDPGPRARAFAEGTAAAFLNHPGKVLETTTQGALGALTFPLAAGGAAVQSVKEGSTKPLEKEATGLYEGTKKMVEGLASGDPKKVEQTTLQESGALPFIPVPHVVRRLKGTKTYKGTRGKVRGTVEGRRAKTRDKRIAAEAEAAAKGEFVPRKKAKKIRQSVADTERPGESYVFRRTGKLREKQRGRHYVSREVSRMQEEGRIGGKLATESVAKPLRRSKGTNQKEQNFGEALRIVVKHGLPADEVRGPAFVKRLHEGWRKNEPGDVPQSGVHLDRHSTQFILEHPEIFKDKRFWKAVENFDARAKEVGTSSRNQYLAQVDNLLNPILREEGRTPILKPEEMITDRAVALLPKRDRPWNRSETLSYIAELKQIKGGDRARAQKLAQALDKEMEGLMKPPEHGGAAGGVSTTRAVAWTPEMERAFVKAAQREAKRSGLRDPAAYVADRFPASLKGVDQIPDFGKQLPLRKVWPSSGEVARSGNALSDFESVVYQSLEAPRARAATVRGLNRIFEKASREVAGKRYMGARELERAINTRQVPDGVIPVRTQALKAILEGELTADPVEFRQALFNEIEHGQKLASSVGDQLRGEIEAAKGMKGEKYAPMDAVMIQELMGHMEGPGQLPTKVGNATNFATGAILNSPAFEAAQFAQEGIPMAAALGRNVANVPKAIASLRQIAKLDPEMQAQVRAVVGSSAGLRGAPSQKALRSEGFMNPIRAAGSKSAWRHAWEIANGDKLSRFDRARAGRFREVAAMAKLEGDFKRAERGFTLWRRSAQNLFKNEQAAVEAMKGMNAAERMAYVTEHPRLADKLMKDMNGMAGNWNSFTVFEKQIAPFAVFYAFQRYSVLWALYHFPLDHPVVATGLATLGAVNAQELKAIAATEGAEPNILDYTKPVVAGETVLPAGQRFFGGLGSIQQAAVEGKPTQALSGLSPPFAIGIEALTGKNAYTGAPLDENGWLYAMRQSANLSPFLRFLGVPEIGQDPSAASKAFQTLDPLRTQRSLFNPYIGQSAQQFAKEKRLSKDFDTKYGKGDIPGPFDSEMVQDLLYGRNGGPKPEMLPQVLREIHAAERASDRVKAAESPFLPPSKDFSPVQKQLLQAVEEAWKTGPNAEPESASKYGGSSKYSSGNKYLEGNKYLQGNKYAE